jgi:hypothetical protein
MYGTASTFEGARRVPAFPTWGQPSKPPLKFGRDRASEVRYVTSRHAEMLRGHYSPGPQYMVPSTIGSSDRPVRPVPRAGGATIRFGDRGAVRPSTRGGCEIAFHAPRAFDISFLRGPEICRPMTAPEATEMRAFWAKTTTLDRPSRRGPLASWHTQSQRENPLYLKDLDDQMMRATSYSVRPKRNSLSPHADPPFATPFGRPNQGTVDFGASASAYIAGYGSTAVGFGKGSGGRKSIQAYAGVW